MKCPKCNHENRDEAKFCEDCGEKLQLKCPKCGAELRSGARFCDGCGTKVSESATPIIAIPKLEDMHAQLQSLIPDALAQKYLSAEQQITAGENRPITALFADISGFTPLSATKSSEAIFHLVQDCFKRLVSIVAKYEGSISGFRGDGLLALFGAPILHENDAERAILSAIDMREAIRDQQLQVSIGINTAMMTVGEIQTQLHNEYTAYGTDINLAKRLQESAEPEQILVGSGTHRLTRRAFDFDIIPSLSLKGFSQPVTAYTVKQVKVHPEKIRGIEGLRARMIGREHEFTDVKEATDEWLSGHGQIVSVIGEAGIGKSRLVSELKTYLSSKDDKQFQYIEGRCMSIGQPISYWPFIDILKTYFNLSEGDDTAIIASKVAVSITQLMPQSADETLPLLGQLLSIKYGNELDDRLKFATPEQIRHQTLMRLRDIFTTLARKQPLLLILEDLHWSDDLSLDLVSSLMDELANTPLMLLCVYRPEHDHRVWQLSNQARRKCMDRFAEIILNPLSSIDSRELIESLLEIENLPETIKKMIMEKSEGNPFFIEEVVRSLIEQGMIYQQDDRWIAKDEILSINVPDTIQSVILSRVDRLQSEAKYVLQCASVIGRLFKYRLLDHLAQHERNLNRYLSEFEEKDLVYEERTVPELEYAFKHALTQEATYQNIIEKRRKEFHHQAAQGIERLYHERLEEYYGELAYHYSRSDESEKAVEYLVKAGNKAKMNYDNEMAIFHFRRALEIIEQHGMECNECELESWTGLGKVYQGIGKVIEAGKAFEKAIMIAKEMELPPPRRLAMLYFWIGDILWWLRRSDDIKRYGEMGLEILGDDTECLEAVLMNSLIVIGNSSIAIGQEYIQRNMAFIKKVPYSEELRPSYVLIITFCRQNGNFDAAFEWSKELETLAGQHHDLRGLAEAYMEQGFISVTRGDLKGALSSYQKSLSIYERIGDVKHALREHSYMAYTLWQLGSIEEAEAHIQRCLMNMEGYPELRELLLEFSNIPLMVGYIAIYRHRWDEAISNYQELIEVNRSKGYNTAWLTFRIGNVYLKKRDYHKAIQFYEEFIKPEDRHPYMLTSIEEAYMAVGMSEKLVEFCRPINELYPNVQPYLEPTKPSDEFTYITFADDFKTDTIELSWTWMDEFKDCSYKIVDDGGLEIHAANERDLANLNLSAPRLMREITSDFAIEVCISPASDEKPQVGGLLIWKDKNNFLRLDKGMYGLREICLHGCVNNEWKLIGRGILAGCADEETYLRLERSGDEFSAYCSIDGENWFTCGKMTLPMEDPIQVGIHAIGMIDRTIYCGEYKEGTATLFRNFRIWTK